MVLGGFPEKLKDDNTLCCLPLSSRKRRRPFRLLFPLSLAKVLLSVFFQFFNLFLQGIQLSVHFRQTLENGLRLEVRALFHGRCTDELLVAFQTTWNTRLCTEEHFIADGDVPGNAYLAAEHTPFPHLSGSGDAHLGRHDGVLADVVVVCYLYEVVEFNAFAHVGAAHGRTVNTGIGADFNIVLDCHDADLWNLVVAVGFCIGGKAEAVGSDY